MSRIWWKIVTIYCFVIFLITALLFVPMTLLFMAFGHSEKARYRYHVILSTVFRFFAFHIPCVRMSVDNRYGEDFSRPSVIISNHQSHLDLLCLLQLNPKIVAVTNDWVWNSPFYGLVVHYCEFYPVSNGVEDMTERMRDLVRRGYSILVFPEGTRSADCSIRRFHPGAFYLAEQLGLDILPAYLHNVGGVLPKDDFTLHPEPMSVELGQRMAITDPAMGVTQRERTRYWHQHYLQKFSSASNVQS